MSDSERDEIVCIWMPGESYDDERCEFPFGYLHADDGTIPWRPGFRRVACRLLPDPPPRRMDYDEARYDAGLL